MSNIEPLGNKFPLPLNVLYCRQIIKSVVRAMSETLYT